MHKIPYKLKRRGGEVVDDRDTTTTKSFFYNSKYALPVHTSKNFGTVSEKNCVHQKYTLEQCWLLSFVAKARQLYELLCIPKNK